MISFAIDGITAFSDFPFRFVTTIGMFLAGVAFLIILYAIASHFIMHKTITGWTSMIISPAFLGGIQLISIGIIGMYISRINNDVRNRPLYIIDKAKIDSEKKEEQG